MKCNVRALIAILSPIPITMLGFIGFMLVWSLLCFPRLPSDMSRLFLVSFFFGLITLVPSLIISGCLASRFRRGLNPSSWKCVWIVLIYWLVVVAAYVFAESGIFATAYLQIIHYKNPIAPTLGRLAETFFRVSSIYWPLGLWIGICHGLVIKFTAPKS